MSRDPVRVDQVLADDQLVEDARTGAQPADGDELAEVLAELHDRADGPST